MTEGAVPVVDIGPFLGGDAADRAAVARTVDEESPPDLIEAFTFGRFDLPETPCYTAHRDTWFEPNIWPDRPPGFRPRLCAYDRAMERLAETLMRIFALALDMPVEFFADKIDRHITAMRLNHYAEATHPPLPGQLRAGAHTDYGSLTILLATAAGGEPARVDRLLPPSSASFHQPNHDAAIDCLPTCRSPDDPPRYDATTSGAHLLAKTAKETGTVGRDG